MQPNHTQNNVDQNQLWVAGFPSFLGGADTELFHNIKLWVKKGVAVHLVPFPSFDLDPKMVAACQAMHCKIEKYDHAIFRDKILIAYCNDHFLRMLPYIVKNGRPKKVVWFNCMTSPFSSELECHQKGWIDLFGFVSQYQEKLLRAALDINQPMTSFKGYKPYLEVNTTDFQYRPIRDYYTCGRISRDDSRKFPADLWNIFSKISSPVPMRYKVLGFGEHALQKCGPAPANLEGVLHLPNTIPSRDLYHSLDCLIHKTGGSRESYCRVVIEAFAHGVPVIAENEYALPEIIQDGITGFLCHSSDEMSFRASQLAFDEQLRKKLIHNAYDFLMEEIVHEEKCWAPWQRLLTAD